MNKKNNKFKNEDEEVAYWENIDMYKYLKDKASVKMDLSDLKMSKKTRSISIRLPESMITLLKSLSTQSDIPYQSLIKIMIQEKISGMKSKK
ncbi:MAG: CopG family antitoxin [Patescibacteria group bacterium]